MARTLKLYLWLWALLSLALALARGIAATTVHLRVHHHHHEIKQSIPTHSTTRFSRIASGDTTTVDEDDTDAEAPRVTCPASDSPLAHATTPALTTACPSSCSANNLCIFYPTAFTTQCTTTTRRKCFHGDACAFQCIPNADRLNGWLLSLYDDAAVVDDIDHWNAVNNDIRSVAINISLVSQWAGRLMLPNSTVMFYVTGNEAANDVSDDDAFYYQDSVSLPKGEIVPFELPVTLYEDVQRLQFLRLENIKAPTMASEHTRKLAFPALVELYLRNTMLKSFPLAHASLPVLTTLDLSVNYITEITRSALPDSLLFLNLSYNAISHLTKDLFPDNLTVIDLATNGITQIPKDTLPVGLEQLFLDGNALTEIPPDVAAMPSLQKLFLDGNSLKDIPESALPPLSMNSLSLINCSLTTIPRLIKKMTALASLNLGNNDLSRDPDFSVLPETLTLLNVDNSQLQQFPAALGNLPNLVTLSIAGNPKAVANLTALPEGLEGLYLNNNGLDIVPTGVQDLSLKFIVLESNPLGHLAPGSLPPTLTGIYLSNATFTTVSAGTLPESLEEISILNSALETVPEDVGAMRNLYSLTLTNCRLESFDVANALPELNYVDLKHNRLTRFTGRYAALTVLDLRHNALQDFNLSSAPLMQTLHLAENNLTTFPLSVLAMDELLLLNLTQNPIRQFTPNVDQFAALARIPVVVLDQEMFATDCDPADRMDLRGYSVCAPSSSNATNLQPHKQSTSKMSVGLVLLNVCLAAALTLLVVTAWRRRELQKKRLFDLDIKTASLEKQQRHQSAASIWSDTVLLQHRLDEDLVERKRVLGTGMYGEVWLAIYKHEPFALKQLKQTGDGIERQLINDFVDEIKLLSSLTHPCVVRFVGVVWSKETDIAMVTEYMAGGDLRSYLDTTLKGDTGWTVQMVRVALNITEAIVYLHSLDPIVIHRDLKSRNVLLDIELHAKLSDFGISRYKLDDDTMTAAVGTIRWVAPEVLAGQRYDESVDVYSLGIILSEMDTHKLPFDDLTDDGGHARLTDSAIAGLLLSGSLTSSFSESCPSEIRSLAERCTSFDSTARPTGLQVAYELRQMLKNASSWISNSGTFHSSSGVEDDAMATTAVEDKVGEDVAETHDDTDATTHVSV